MSRFSPSDAALEGFRLTRERPGTILAWGLINFLGISIIGGLMLLMLGGPFVEFVKNGGMSAGDPEALANMLAKSWPAFLMLLAVVVLFMSVLTAGIYRLVLRPGEHGFMHLRVGVDEFRLTAVNLLLFVIGLVCLVLVDLVGNIVTSTAGVAAGLLAALVVAVPMIWIGVRFSLATPMTFAEHRIDLRAAWDVTRGSFWPLFGMIILAAVFYVMVWALILIIYAAVVALSGGPETLKALENGVITPQAIIALIAVVVLQLILPVLQWVMIYSPLAVAYQHLRERAAG